LCLLTGVSAAVFFRHSRYWLKIHKYFNSISVIFLFSGVTTAVIMVWQKNGEHLDGFHPIFGSITLGLTIVTIFLGFYQFKAKSGIQVVKTFHRWMGRLSLLAVIVALIAGLVRAGII
jgi:cation transport ATPase